MSSDKLPRAERKLLKKTEKAEKAARLKERMLEANSPRTSFSPTKSVRQGADPGSIMQMQITFDVHGSADRADEWSWGQHRNWCKSHQKELGNCEIMSTMMGLAGSKWSEILAMTAGGHKRNHDQDLDTIIPEARERWKSIGRVEETLFRFRTSGKGRIWGYRTGAHFNVVWWDPEHLIYPTEKKNT